MNGPRIGLEIHQQLAAGKLFCRCPSELHERVRGEFVRHLSPTLSELGDVDKAARLESEKGMSFRYQDTESSCLVEADEEPPHRPDEDAIDLALTVALMLGAEPVDEIEFMRKIVLDGSNTTGFQRTALIARGGEILVGGERVRISAVCLEEDAARRVESGGCGATFRLDRLGIPLVEVATEPDIGAPDMARDAALAIGRLLRDTGKARRGIGSVREDINISVPGGARVEIKGVQELGMISSYISGEIGRQERLIGIARVLAERVASAPSGEAADITHLLKGTGSKMVSGAIAKGGKALAIRLPGFAGALGIQKDGGKGLGTELAQRARTVGVKGLMHSDELPGYGITDDEKSAIEKELRCGPTDAFLFLVADGEKGKAAIARVTERAAEALKGVPEETRDPAPDGGSTYSRPLPGGARMYPETDVPPILVTEERLKRLRENLPKSAAVRKKELKERYPGIDEQRISIAVDEREDGLIGEILERICACGAPDPKTASVVFSAVLYTPESKALSKEELTSIFTGLAEGSFSKEAVPAVIAHYAANPGATLASALGAIGAGSVSSGEMEKIISEVVAENKDLISARGEGALAPLMGEVMKRLRGRADGKLVSEALKREMKKLV
ncbi:MAG: Glu-tRNA(Gln) amidotransferase subunit GatE [Euryarchaeota archaeon]|nr:Glu-tRNA(Gln) amidotransferase subunit GatE [Euryarchaeota archaeon]